MTCDGTPYQGRRRYGGSSRGLGWEDSGFVADRDGFPDRARGVWRPPRL